MKQTFAFAALIFAIMYAGAVATLPRPANDGVVHLWGFVDGNSIQNRWTDMAELPAQTSVSQAMSKDLRRRCFTFVGPTICYAFMQASGLVNDHLVSCPRHAAVAALAPASNR